MTKAIIGFLLMLLVHPAAYASVTFDEPLQPDEAFELTLTRAADASIELRWKIIEGYYLYRDRMTARSTDGTPVPLETLPGTIKDDPNFGPSEVYYRKAVASFEGTLSGQIEVTYQGCQEDGICYAPETRLLDPVTLAISNPPSHINRGVQWSSEASTDSGSFQLAPEQNLVESLLGKGVPVALGMFLLFGVLLAFSPCVFPMYPIVAATLAREGEALTAGRGFALTAAYVVGLASAFALVGAAAGWSGQNLQMYLQSTWMTGFVASVFVILALSMFGLFELQLPTSLTSWIATRTGRSRGSIGSSAAVGFSSALIVGPCVTAPLAGALLYIARTGDSALGAAALFALGLGKGIPLLVLGTFGGRLLPRAGAWMEMVKSGFAVVFLGTAVWLVTPFMPAGLDLALYAVLLFGASTFLFWSEFRHARMRILSRTMAMIACIWGITLTVGAASGSTDPFRPLAALGNANPPIDNTELPFTPVETSEQLQAQLTQGNAPSLVFFTADWCVTCKTIERSVFPDVRVRSALSGLQLVKIDVTDFDAQDAELMTAMRVAGPPTMLFFDAQAREIEGTRLVGTIDVGTITQSASRTAGMIQ